MKPKHVEVCPKLAQCETGQGLRTEREVREGGGRRKEGKEDEKEHWMEKGRGREKKREGRSESRHRHTERQPRADEARSQGKRDRDQETQMDRGRFNGFGGAC